MRMLPVIICALFMSSCTPPNSKSQSGSLSAVDGGNVGAADGSGDPADCVKSSRLMEADRLRTECLAVARQTAETELNQFLTVDMPRRRERVDKLCDYEQQRVYATCSGGSHYVKEFCAQSRSALDKCQARQKSEGQLLVEIERNVRERIDLTHRQSIYRCENEYSASVVAANRCSR